MLFALVILSIYMGWVEAVIAKPVESDEAPFPKPPEFLRRDREAEAVAEQADQLIRRKQGIDAH